RRDPRAAAHDGDRGRGHYRERPDPGESRNGEPARRNPPMRKEKRVRNVSRLVSCMGLAVLAGVALAPAEAQVPPRQQRARAIEGMVESSGDESLRQFIDTQLAPAYRELMEPGDLLAKLRSIREAAAGLGGVLYERVGDDGLRVTFVGGPKEVSVLFRI